MRGGLRPVAAALTVGVLALVLGGCGLSSAGGPDDDTTAAVTP